MNNFKTHLFSVLFIISLVCNVFWGLYLIQEERHSSSITKFVYDMHDTVIYCEKNEETQSVKLNYDKKLFTIDNSSLLCADDSVYFIGSEGEIRLSDYEGEGFIINNNGELLYSLNRPTKKQVKVYITPSGKKYHTDPNCAGKTGFEMPLDTAMLLRTPCNICT